MIKVGLIKKRVSKITTVLLLTTAMTTGSISGIVPAFSSVDNVFATVERPTETVVESDFECLVYLDDGTCYIQKWKGEASSVVIPSKIGEYTVEGISCGAFEGCSGIQSVEIPEGVKYIFRRAFYGCIGLTSVNIPDSVTSIKDETFYGCTGLTSVDIPDSVTSIGDEAFYGCTGLTSVDIPDSVRSIGYGAFSRCTGLVSIDLPNIYMISDKTFFGCSSLENIDIPDNNGIIGTLAFGGCSSLQSIKIPSRTESIEATAFSNCESLSVIEVDEANETYDSRDNCNAVIRKKDDYLVCGCKDTIIPDSVKVIGKSSFHKCKELKNITIPSGVASIEEQAFWKCTGLESITIPAGVTNVDGSAFYDCKNLESIKVDKDNKVYDSRNDCNAIINTKSNSLIRGNKNTKIPKEVTKIGAYAFGGCTGLRSIELPSGLKNIDYGAFCGCSSLKTISIPKNTKIGLMVFHDDNKLNIKCYRNSPAHIYAVKNNKNYVLIDDKKLNIKKGLKIKDETTHGNYMVTSVTSKGGTVEYCSCTNNDRSLIKIPDGITINGKFFEVTSIAENANKNNKNTKYLYIGGNVKKIGKNAFYGNKNLRAIIVQTNKLKKGSIKNDAFKGIKSTAVIESQKVNLESCKQAFKNTGVSKQTTYKDMTLKDSNYNKIKTDIENYIY